MLRTTDNHDPGRPGPLLADIPSIPWADLGEGARFKLLRYSEVTGDWVLFVQLAPGTKFGRHRHISPAEFYITKGELVFEQGSAKAGTYGYEVYGEIHEEAAGVSETEFLYFGHGPVTFIDENDQVQFVVDLDFYRRAWKGDLTDGVVDEEASRMAAE
jgi:hypothetical protein